MKLLCQLLPFLCQKNMYTCIKMFFTTTIDTMLFSVSFTESWTPETGTTTDPTGSPEHRKNDLDEVQAGSGAITYPEELICYLNVCYTVLYS